MCNEDKCLDQHDYWININSDFECKLLMPFFKLNFPSSFVVDVVVQLMFHYSIFKNSYLFGNFMSVWFA